MDALTAYYGLDWLGMVLSLLAVYQLGNKKRIGFITFILGNAVWVFLGLSLMNSLGVAVGNAIFLVMNARGYLKWTREGIKPSEREV
jgi:hypothetical protein